MNKIIKKIYSNHNFLSLVANFSTSLMGLLSFVILTRTLSIDDFGIWVMFTTPMSLIDMLRFGLTREATVRYMSSINEEEKKKLIGSSWIVGLITIFVISIILYISFFIFSEPIEKYGYSMFFLWYPVFAISNLPWNYAWSNLQAELDFKNILWIRFYNMLVFLISILLMYYIKRDNMTVYDVLAVYIVANILTSVFCILKKWTGILYIFKFSKPHVINILNYGKYSMASKIGSSLLKSADSFIISFSAYCGPTGVAMYAIPLKFVEILEIPLRSFVSTAFPKLSKASIDNNLVEFKKIFYTYAGSTSVLLIFVALITFAFNKYLILILGGNQYMEHIKELSYIMIAFIIYGLMLPIDRFTGVALDSLNKPQKNFYKIIYMAVANIIGDIIAIFVMHYFFPELSIGTLLLFVAIASIIFTIIGLIVGFNFLKREIPVNYKDIYITGFKFYYDNIKFYYNTIRKKA